MTERLDQVLFAEFLNQCGCVTGVDTEKFTPVTAEKTAESCTVLLPERFADHKVCFHLRHPVKGFSSVSSGCSPILKRIPESMTPSARISGFPAAFN